MRDNPKHHQPPIIFLCTLLLLTLTHSQLTLEPDKIQTLSLLANNHTILTLTVPAQLSQKHNLFISAQSSYNDPFQQPIVNVKSDNDYELQCYDQADSYTGICMVENKELKVGRVFSVEVYCVVDCVIRVAAYFNEIYVMQVSSQLQIKSMSDYALAQVLKLPLPSTLNFTSIALIAKFQNSETATQGITILANYGPNSTIPTQSQYSKKAQPSFNNRLIIQITSTQVKAGQNIYVYMFLGVNNTVEFSCVVENGGNYEIEVGNVYTGYTSDGQKKEYHLDLGKEEDRKRIEGHDIFVKVIIFSGAPDIKLSFDPNFTNTLSNTYIDSSFTAILSPQYRQSKSFNQSLHLRISSYFLSSYTIQITINNKDFISLQTQMMQLCRIMPDGIQNFIYEDENYVNRMDAEDEGIVRYKATVRMIQGGVQMGLRDCDSLRKDGEDVDVQACVIKDKATLVDPQVRKTFDNVQGQLKRYYNTYQILFSYNVSTCPKYSENSPQEHHTCTFHIILHNPPRTPPRQAYLGIEITKYTQHKLLKQSQQQRDTVLSQQYNYYSFQLSSIQNIQKIEIYTTVLQGDVSILWSMKEKYPEFQGIGEQKGVEISVRGRVVVDGDRLRKGVYYVSVYGYDVSQYMIGVVVRRNTTDSNNNETKTTIIPLQKSLTQTFTLQPPTKSLLFSLHTPLPQPLALKLTQLQNSIDYTVYQKQYLSSSSTIPFICNSLQLSKQNKDTCTINATPNVQYIVEVTSVGDRASMFAIGYMDGGSSGGDDDGTRCASYPIDVPMFLSVDISDKYKGECFQYTLYEIDDIQVTVTMSDIDKLRSKGQIGVRLTFLPSGKTIQLDQYQHIIPKSQLQTLCTSSSSSSSSSFTQKSNYCRFTLSIAASPKFPDITTTVQLMIAVQAYDDQNFLFDGIPEKVISDKMSDKFAKKFYYYVYDVKDVRDLNIYLASDTDSKYTIAARVVSDTTFAKDLNNQQYPQSATSPLQDTLSSTSTPFSPITSLTVPSSSFTSTTTTSAYVVLISVFGLGAQKQKYIFKIQATMRSTSLYFGESKIGYVDQDQVYEYEVELDGKASVVEVRGLGQGKCFGSYYVAREFVKQGVDDEGKFAETMREFQKIRVFSTEKGPRKIRIKGIGTQICTYQISFNQLQTPVKSILKGIPYQISVTSSQTPIQYYLYKSNHNNSILFIQMINSGNAILYATTIKETQGQRIQDMINKNIETWGWKSQLNGDLLVQKDAAGWEDRAYWLVAVKGKDKAVGELIVNIQGEPIPLKQGSILLDKLTNTTTNQYFFYSLTSFNLTLNPIYGRISITVLYPTLSSTQTPKTIQKTNISTLTQIVVDVPKQYAEGSGYYDSGVRFLINVTAIKESSYYVGVKKVDNLRVYEGVPMMVEVGVQGITVQWTNSDADTPIQLLIQDHNYFSSPTNTLTFTPTPSPLLSQSQSQSTYTLSLVSILTSYSLLIKSQYPTNITITLYKSSMTHLLAGRTVLVSKPSIFQIFSPGDSVMVEVFSCIGDIEVMASRNYSKLVGGEQEGVVRMEHANYGGHYVISSQNLQGQYYIRTQSLNPQQPPTLSYLISYYLYTDQQKMPYKTYSIPSPYIQYSYRPQNIEFTINKIIRKDNKRVKGTAIYTLYIANNNEDISRMVKCNMGDVYKMEITENDVEIGAYAGTASFKIKDQELRKVIGSSNYYYIGGQSKFVWPNQKPHHTKAVYFVYETSQMVTGNTPEFKQSKKSDNVLFVLLWIVVPFCIGSFVFYLAIKYFINSVRQGPNQLIEEEGAEYGESQEVFGNTSGKVQQGKGINVVDAGIDKYAIE